ncbi:hypothetical protein PR202_gb13202 [Eleusine coracana subsp. coracana]|uniref:Agenet domain-containing protein n=1 Tax=Eleusine coracana subsp. coracana TaxID=191504 RepID=A0AAV5ETH6_ELECO|nr:hypothetical protein PR202_gb13202 [Eleusine coracana subsp. coracana]
MASSGRRGRRRNRGWSYPRKNRPRAPPSSPSPSPESAAGASSAAGDGGLPLPPGTEVEVRVDDDGFHGSWFEATIADFSPASGRREPARYTVTYSHLLADDGGGVLAEHFPPSHIRPRPPQPVGPAPPFRLDDIVEAFHNDGWWSGIVVAAPAPAGPTPATVTVAFPITRELIPFPPHLVRPRRDFVNGEWVPSRAVVAVRPKRAVKAYNVGDKVEVGRDREVFGYSWFPATVAEVVDPLSYVVEYFDQEVEGDAGAEKATEYLHWRFIRPAVEHVPPESEFQLSPGAAVEAYCDGAWSPGIVRRVVGDGEFEVSIDGKEKEVLLNKVAELLKPQYSWNGKQWRIVSAKRQANLRRRSMSGRSPNSPVDVASSGDEHSNGRGSSAIKKSRSAPKRPRKEPLQQELLLAEDLVDVSISEVDIPLTAFCKSPERNHSLLSGRDNLEVINQEIMSEVLLDSQLNTPTCGTGAGNSCDTLSIAELRNKMASANSAGQQTQERLLSVKALKVKKDKSNSERGKTHPFVELQGKHGASDSLIKNGSAGHKEIICALSASVHCQASSMLDKQVSSQTRSGSHTKDLDRSLEDTYQELFPLIPPGFESMYNAEGIDIRDSLLDEELTNGLRQADTNGMLSIDHAAIQLATSSQVVDAPTLPMEHPIQQERENYQNAGSSHSTVDNSKLRRCSMPSHLALSQISGHLGPFVKRSPAWSIVEASNVFKLVPQHPHFLPLRKHSLEIREGIALGLMVAFATLVENVREASIEESMEFFEDKIKTLCHLEANGFNVQFLQSRLTKMLQIKSNCSKYLGEMNKLDAEMVGKTTSLSRMDALLDQKGEAIGQLEQQLAHLRQETQQIEKDREHEDAEMSRLKSKHSRFEEAFREGKQQFWNLLDDLREKLS